MAVASVARQLDRDQSSLRDDDAELQLLESGRRSIGAAAEVGSAAGMEMVVENGCAPACRGFELGTA
jgi:hypothetical protein